MERSSRNRGFSLVELIIAVAIMAVLIGVMTPAYLRYVEKTKMTKDCTAIGSVMDSVTTVAADPGVMWEQGEKVAIEIGDSADYDYSGAGTDVETAIADLVPEADVHLTGSWSTISFDAIRDTNGTVKFVNLSGVSITDIKAISPALAERFE